MTPAERMAELRKSAEEALAAIPKEEWVHMGAVNWGDIRIAEVRHWMNEREDLGYMVYLEEAAPGAELADEIFKRMGFPQDVEVVCGW